MTAEAMLSRCLSGHRPKQISDETREHSAILIPIFIRNDSYHVVYTRRSTRVAYHKGQISFPGGKRSNEDADLRETALRESWEEIGLRKEDVTIIGQLDDTKTATSNFIITPFVGLIPHPYIFKGNDFECDEVFDIPLSALVHEARIRCEEYTEGTERRIAHYYELRNRVIWGATATITTQLLDLLKSCPGAQGQSVL